MFGEISPRLPGVNNKIWANNLILTAGGRLTLTSGSPVTTGDVTAATTVYYTPYKGSLVPLYDGIGAWGFYNFNELSIAVPATTSQVYDYFLYYDNGTVKPELLAWTSDTARATNIVLQNGLYVKSGDSRRLYAGSIRTTGSSGQTEDSLAKRYIYNYYNRVLRPMKVIESTDSWNYSSTTIRQVRATASNQLDAVIGVAEDLINITATNVATNSTSTLRQIMVGIGINSTTTPSSSIAGRITTDTQFSSVTAIYNAIPSIGRQTFVWLESSAAADTQTFYGDNGATSMQAGIIGTLPM